MSTGPAGGEKVSERLHESLARLREEINRVEMWAGALEGFSQPIPDYDAARRYRLSAGGDGSAEESVHAVPKKGTAKKLPAAKSLR